MVNEDLQKNLFTQQILSHLWMVYVLGISDPCLTPNPRAVPESLCVLVILVYNSTNSAQAKDLEITCLAPYLDP